MIWRYRQTKPLRRADTLCPVRRKQTDLITTRMQFGNSSHSCSGWVSTNLILRPNGRLSGTDMSHNSRTWQTTFRTHPRTALRSSVSDTQTPPSGRGHSSYHSSILLHTPFQQNSLPVCPAWDSVSVSLAVTGVPLAVSQAHTVHCRAAIPNHVLRLSTQGHIIIPKTYIWRRHIYVRL